jgi:HIRAN domain
MNLKLILAWRTHHTKEWAPVGKISWSNDEYRFEYTECAKEFYKSGSFETFANLEDINNTYDSKEIFPFLKNRLLQKSRPEYKSYQSWLDLAPEDNNPLNELARSGGIRATDDLQLYPYPVEKAGNYEVLFFSHGIRHIPNTYLNRINALKHDDRLYIMRDIQNEYDPNALVLRTEKPIETVGYVPRFFAYDFNSLIDINGPENVIVRVQKVNNDSPTQFRLLCKLTTTWPEEFKLFSSYKIDKLPEALQ